MIKSPREMFTRTSLLASLPPASLAATDLARFVTLAIGRLGSTDLPGVRSNGYGFQIEMNYRAWRLGYRLHETPIIFADRREGTSKMNKKIAIEALVVVWWLKLADLMGRLEKPKLVRVDGPGSS